MWSTIAAAIITVSLSNNSSPTDIPEHIDLGYTKEQAYIILNETSTCLQADLIAKSWLRAAKKQYPELTENVDDTMVKISNNEAIDARAASIVVQYIYDKFDEPIATLKTNYQKYVIQSSKRIIEIYMNITTPTEFSETYNREQKICSEIIEKIHNNH